MIPGSASASKMLLKIEKSTILKTTFHTPFARNVGNKVAIIMAELYDTNPTHYNPSMPIRTNSNSLFLVHSIKIQLFSVAPENSLKKQT